MVEGKRLGVSIQNTESNGLLIASIGDGLMNEWNEDHVGSEVRPGHSIVEANGIRHDPELFLNACVDPGPVLELHILEEALSMVIIGSRGLTCRSSRGVVRSFGFFPELRTRQGSKPRSGVEPVRRVPRSYCSRIYSLPRPGPRWSVGRSHNRTRVFLCR